MTTSQKQTLNLAIRVAGLIGAATVTLVTGMFWGHLQAEGHPVTLERVKRIESTTYDRLGNLERDVDRILEILLERQPP